MIIVTIVSCASMMFETPDNLIMENYHLQVSIDYINHSTCKTFVYTVYIS